MPKSKDEIEKLLADLTRMGRLDEKWRRLLDLVEKEKMPADAAIRGFRLAIEAELDDHIDPAAGQKRLVDFSLSLAERAELERLRTLVFELEGRLAKAPAHEDRSVPPTVAARKCPSIPPSKKTVDPVENWRKTIEDLFRLYEFNVGVPRPAVTSEELASGEKENQKLIYRPPDLTVSYGMLLQAIGLGGHSTLRESDRNWIGFSPTGEGYWFWAEVALHAPHRGRNFEGFVQLAPAGWEVLLLEEHLHTWLVMKDIFCDTIDEDEPVCLRTAYHEQDGADEVLQVRSHLVGGRVEFLVRALPRNAMLAGRLGARYRKLVPSVRD